MKTFIRTEGFEELIGRFKNAPQVIQRHMLQAMRRSLVIVESKVLPKVPIGATKGLYNSMGSEVESIGALHVQGRFGSSITEEYPGQVESGRPAGTSPRLSSGDLLLWVKRKLNVPEKDALFVAFAVARKINREGFEGQFFMKKGRLNSRPVIVKEFNAIPNEVLLELLG